MQLRVRCVTALAIAAVASVAACSSTAPTAGGPPTTSPSPASTSAASPTGAATSAAPARPLASAQRTAAPNPCVTNTAKQLVKVSIRRQHLWMCAGRTLVRDTAVTTGIPGENTHTPTGTYTVEARTRNTTLTLISGRTYAVKYWIPFDAPLFGFHDSSWQTIAYGSQRYRTDGSHGCVHMPLTAIAFLYHWVHVGAKVSIRS